MATDSIPTGTEAAIWERVIHPDGELTAPAARAILKLQFNPRDRQRMHELSLKAQEGRLTPTAEAEFESFDRVATTLSILKSRARKVLKDHPRR